MRFFLGLWGVCLLLALGVADVRAGAKAPEDAAGSQETITDAKFDTSAVDESQVEEGGGASLLEQQPASSFQQEGLLAEVVAAPSAAPERTRGLRRMVLGLTLFLLTLAVHYLGSIDSETAEEDELPTIGDISRNLVDAGEKLSDDIYEKLNVEINVHAWVFFSTLLMFAHGLQRFVATSARRRDFMRGQQLRDIEGLFPLGIGLGGMLAGATLPELEPANGFGIPFAVVGSILLANSLLKRRKEKGTLKNLNGGARL